MMAFSETEVLTDVNSVNLITLDHKPLHCLVYWKNI